MSETKFYEEGDFRFEFTPDGGPFEGLLVARAPELEPHTAVVNLPKPRSCSAYAARAHELCGMSKGGLKVTLNALCSRRYEEVAAAREAEQQEQQGSDPAEEHPEVSEEEIEGLVGRPGVLGRLAEGAAACSRVVGERDMLKLIALVALSAQLALLPNGKPIGTNVMLSGEAGRGKNYLCDAVARLLPAPFYLAFESSSAKALYYAAQDDPTFFTHRFVYPNEAEATDLLVEVLRPLLSGGSARHLTVNKDASGRNVGQEFTIEGPVTVAIPTVRNKLDGQLQSRMLVGGLEDYPGRVAAHSGAVSGLLSPDYAATDHGPQIRAWQAALGSLTELRRVVTPVEHEGFRFDSDEVSHGARLWANLLGLVCAHAWLEQRNREVMELPGGERAIVAAPEDYEAAYEVFRETCERSVVNLSGTHRKILDAVYELTNRAERKEWEGMFAATGGVSQRDIAQRAGVAQSTVAANKTFLVKSAKLLWEPEGGGLALVKDAEPSWWEEGDALDGFPRPEEVRAWWGGEGSPPHPPEPPDRADRDPSGAEKPRDEGARGDRQPADRGQEATDRPHRPDDHGPPGDRQVDGDDRGAADQDNGVPKANNPTTGEAIGMIGGFANHEQETKKHDPERIAELAASLRKRVAQDPGVLRLEHDYTDFGLELAAARLRWDSYGLSPKNFTEEEVHEALKILLEEGKIRKVISVPLEIRC